MIQNNIVIFFLDPHSPFEQLPIVRALYVFIVYYINVTIWSLQKLDTQWHCPPFLDEKAEVQTDLDLALICRAEPSFASSKFPSLP